MMTIGYAYGTLFDVVTLTGRTVGSVASAFWEECDARIKKQDFQSVEFDQTVC